MNNVSRETQDLMRRIVLPKERRAVWGEIPVGDGVAGGQGSYWFGDGSSTGGTDGRRGGDKEPPPKDKDGKDKKDEDKDKDKDKNNGGGGGDGGNGNNGDGDGADGNGGDDGNNDDGGGFDPANVPQPGGNGSHIGPFYDCGDKGRCIGVALNPQMAKTPAGRWGLCDGIEDVTSVPGVFVYSATLSVRRNGKQVKVKETQGASRYGSVAAGEIESVIGGQPLSHVYLESVQKAVANRGGVSTGGGLTSYGRIGEGDYSCSLSLYFIDCDSKNLEPELKQLCREPPKTALPADECLQLLADGAGFKPACNYQDLPAHLAGEGYTSFTLCDKNGNPVTVSRDGQGWKIDHPDYTATVGADFKVNHVVKKPKN